MQRSLSGFSKGHPPLHLIRELYLAPVVLTPVLHLFLQLFLLFLHVQNFNSLWRFLLLLFHSLIQLHDLVLQGRRRLCMVSFSWVFSSLHPLSRSIQFWNKSRLCNTSPCKLLIWLLRPLSWYCSAIPIVMNPFHWSKLIAPVGAGWGLPANRARSTPAMPNKKRPYKKTPYLQCEVAKTKKKWVTEVAPGKLSRHFWRKCSMHLCTRASFTGTWGYVIWFFLEEWLKTDCVNMWWWTMLARLSSFELFWANPLAGLRDLLGALENHPSCQSSCTHQVKNHSNICQNYFHNMNSHSLCCPMSCS